MWHLYELAIESFSQSISLKMEIHSIRKHYYMLLRDTQQLCFGLALFWFYSMLVYVELVSLVSLINLLFISLIRLFCLVKLCVSSSLSVLVELCLVDSSVPEFIVKHKNAIFRSFTHLYFQPDCDNYIIWYKYQKTRAHTGAFFCLHILNFY